MKRLFIIGALSALLLTACSEIETDQSIDIEKEQEALAKEAEEQAEKEAEELEKKQKEEEEAKEKAEKDAEKEAKKEAKAELKAEKEAEKQLSKEEKESEKKAKKEAKELEKANKEDAKKAAEVSFYKNNVASKIDGLQKEYDKVWNELWIATFNGVSDGTVNSYNAYQNMTDLESKYSSLSQSMSNVEGDDLSKENKKHLDEYKSKFKRATSYRMLAARNAAKMFDGGEFRPSEFEDIKSIISDSDYDMLSAVVSRSSIEANLGLNKQAQQ